MGGPAREEVRSVCLCMANISDCFEIYLFSMIFMKMIEVANTISISKMPAVWLTFSQYFKTRQYYRLENVENKETIQENANLDWINSTNHEMKQVQHLKTIISKIWLTKFHTAWMIVYSQWDWCECRLPTPMWF